MTAVSDVLAFAAQHPDYWGELLSSGGEYPDELDADEVEALEAATDHIGEQIESILHLAAERIVELYAGPGQLRLPRFKPTATRRNQMLRLPPPKRLQSALYGLEVIVEEAWDGKSIEVFVALNAKKSALDGIVARLASRGFEAEPWEYRIYGEGQPLVEGVTHERLATALAQSMCVLLSGCVGD